MACELVAFMAQIYFGRCYSGGARRPAPAPSAAGSRRPTASLLATIALGLWAGGASLYIVFHDDALMLLVEHQAAMAQSHSAEVRELMTEVERLRSLKMIDQERVERALAELGKRQVKLEERESVLGNVAASARREPAPEMTGAIPRPSEPAPLKPTPLSDTILIAPPLERAAQLESRPAAPFALRLTRADDPLTRQIVELGRDVQAFDARQAERMNALEEELDERARRVHHVLADLALPTPAAAPAKAGMGGPFVPYFGKSEDPFERQLMRIRAAAENEAELTRALDRVPVKRPLREAEVTSPFGVRLDPFLRQPALHAGVDFRGESGGPVQATAAGRVISAGYNGGYGLMVDVDHGGGLVTRYAHLSATTVVEGAEVKPGDIIGRIGTTGRSTGPHLHYEVRVNGEPVDPQRFLRAGLRLDTAL